MPLSAGREQSCATRQLPSKVPTALNRMPKPKIRVLLDLSMTLHSTSGIPQDARLLYKTLAACDEIDVTGLIYSPLGLQFHNFVRPTAGHGELLSNQAMFLWSLSKGGESWSRFRIARIAKKLHNFGRTIFAQRADLQELDTEMFWQVLWRLMFADTLKAQDMDLVRNGKFILSNLTGSMIYARGLTNRRPMKLDTRGFDFLIVQGGRPFRVSPGTQKIVRYHDMIPVLQPDTRPNPQDIAWHHKAIKLSLGNSFYVCNSDPTRNDLVKVYPEFRDQSATIPYMLSEMYYPDARPEVLRSIIELRRSHATGVYPARRVKPRPKYIMCVSTLEPRKNFVGLIQAMNELKSRTAIQQRARGLKLLIVGSPGWQHEPIMAAMREPIRRGDLIHLEGVSADELRVLYSCASAFVFPSQSEGFGFPPVEAMMCDTPVVASDIPAHRWVLGDAAMYCNPYDRDSIVASVEQLLAADGAGALRDDLVARGRERAELYSQQRCGDQWQNLLHQLKFGEPAHSAHTFALPRRNSMDRVA